MAERTPAVDRFILLYALAWAGGTIAYTPLLTILLPVQVEAIAGRGAGVNWLAYIALAGAIAASIGGILFGYLSDITRNRRGWIAAGLVLSCGMLVLIGEARSFAALLTTIVCWQLALNMMLGPLAALAGDVVPDRSKGLLGGLMAFAPGLGALSGAIVTLPGLATGPDRGWLVAGLVAGCIMPVLFLRPQRPRSDELQQGKPPPAEGQGQGSVASMWFARLAVQVAEATLFAYLYFWLVGLNPAVSDNQTARLFSLVMLASAPIALAVGRWSDRASRPIAPLQGGALGAALGLVVMALAPDLTAAMLGYGLFGVASAVFLALHSAQTLRILPRPDRRGRDLGIFNLANTLPSLVMPWLAMALVPVFGFPALFLLLALLALLAAVLLRVLTAKA